MIRQPLAFFDASRWVAALLVVTHHARHLILTDYPNVAHPTRALQALYFMTGFGHEAVVVFFVISGFLVGGMTLDKWRRDGANSRDYLSARVARIYVVLLPALAVSMLLDLIGATWVDASQLYSHAEKYHTFSLLGVINERLSPATLLGNVFMLQNIAVPVLGSNGPLWSLAYEWWYYCIFYLAAILIFEPTRAHWVACTVSLAGLALLLPSALFMLGVFWLLGVLLHHTVRAGRRVLHPALGLLLFLGAMFWSRLHHLDIPGRPDSLLASFRRDLIVALGYSALACSMVDMRLPLQKVHHALADFSYSTYLVHFPMLIFSAACLNQAFGVEIVRQPDVGGLVYLAALTLFLYIYAYGFSLLTERRTDAARNWLRNRLPRRVGWESP